MKRFGLTSLLLVLVLSTHPVTLSAAESEFETFLGSFDYELRDEMKISSKELVPLLISNKGVLVDIRFPEEVATWKMGFGMAIPLNELPRTCIPCKKMAPILEALATEYKDKANVLFVDVWEDKATAKKFRVQMIPTQIFFDAKGKEVKRHVGGMEKTDILKELKAAGLK